MCFFLFCRRQGGNIVFQQPETKLRFHLLHKEIQNAGDGKGEKSAVCLQSGDCLFHGKQALCAADLRAFQQVFPYFRKPEFFFIIGTYLLQLHKGSANHLVNAAVEKVCQCPQHFHTGHRQVALPFGDCRRADVQCQSKLFLGHSFCRAQGIKLSPHGNSVIFCSLHRAASCVFLLTNSLEYCRICVKG